VRPLCEGLELGGSSVEEGVGRHYKLFPNETIPNPEKVENPKRKNPEKVSF
jgi:hypothetical protein